MDNITFCVFAFVAALWLVLLLSIGVVFGFGAFLLALACVVCLCLIWREVPVRRQPELRTVYIAGWPRLIAA